jgi:hypothetical protein
MAARTFLDFLSIGRIREGSRGGMIRGKLMSQGLMIMHKLHAGNLLGWSEGAEVLTKQINQAPGGVGPLEAVLHVNSEVIAIDVELEHGIEVAGQSKAIDRNGDLGMTQVGRFLSGKQMLEDAML